MLSTRGFYLQISGYQPSNSLTRSRVAWLTSGPVQAAVAVDEAPTKRRSAAEGLMSCMMESILRMVPRYV